MDVFNHVLGLFIVMLVGFAARKLKLFNDAFTQGMTDLLFYFSLPAMMLMAFQFDLSAELVQSITIVAVGSVAVHLISIGLCGLLFRKAPCDSRQVMWYGSTFSNSVYMGMPVLKAAFGPLGVLLGSVNAAVVNLFQWTAGIMIFTGRQRLRDVLRALCTPSMLAIAAGFALFLIGVKMPMPLSIPLEMVGGMTSPVAMIIAGIRLADSPFWETVKDWRAYVVSAMRLIVIPLSILAVFRLLSLGTADIAATGGSSVGVLVCVFGMPSGATVTIFSEKYGANSHLAARCVFISTLLSIATVPLILMLL